MGISRVKLSYRQLEAILAAYLGVHPDKMFTFRSRMKQLQRLEFPAGVNIGRGIRMTYTAEHLLQLAAAFEVIGAGLAAKAATDVVSQYWDRFQAAFGRAHSKLSFKSDFETFVCIAGKPPVAPEREVGDPVSVHDLTSLTEQVLCFPRPDHQARAGMIIIRADYMLERVNRLAGDIGQVRNPKWATEYGEWASKRDGDQQLWDYADGGSDYPF